MKLSDKKSFVQFIKFGIVGVSNTVISLLIYYLFISINQELYQVGNIVGWVVSVANAFFWNNKYVFMCASSSRKNILKRLVKTYLSYGGTFLLSTVLLYLEIDIWEVSPIFSPIINLLITVPLNFLLNKFWTFQK